MVLVLIFILAAPSLTQNARAQNLTPTPTPSPTPQASKFGYSTVGKENSSLPKPKTVTLCNYTTPHDIGVIVQISIYLTGTSEGSQVKAVIFANEPETQSPQCPAPIAQSLDTLNVTSVSGEWYNFTMNYPASPNTVYWLGYYSDNLTHYFFDATNNSISFTSQPEDGNSTWIPVGWYYQGKSVMSLYALYKAAEPQLSPTHQGSGISTPASSLPDTLFVLVIISWESVIMISARRTQQTREKKRQQTIASFQHRMQ